MTSPRIRKQLEDFWFEDSGIPWSAYPFSHEWLLAARCRHSSVHIMYRCWEKMSALIRTRPSILELRRNDWANFDGPRVVAYGLGTDSTAMLIQLVKMKYRVDLILFADVGGEKPLTYEFLPVFDHWLRRHNYPGVTVVEYFTRDKQRLTLEKECLSKSILPSLAYGYKKCSLKHKVAPQDKFVNNWEPARQAWREGKRVLKFIGFDATEGRRCTFAGASPDARKYVYRYPLIDWGITREECIRIIAQEGLPQPGKSACFYCPATKKPEIVQLGYDHPDLLKRALVMERQALPGLKTVKGLGRRFSWIEYVAETAKEDARLRDSLRKTGSQKIKNS
jgi:hypothetical protein